MEWLLAWCKENEAVFASPDSYSPQCMMEGNDMHVNTLISLCSSFSRLTTNPDFFSHTGLQPGAANVKVHTGQVLTFFLFKDFRDNSLFHNTILAEVYTHLQTIGNGRCVCSSDIQARTCMQKRNRERLDKLEWRKTATRTIWALQGRKKKERKKERRERRNNPSLFNPTLKAALHHVFQKLSHEECTPMMSLRDFFLESRDYSLHGH